VTLVILRSSFSSYLVSRELLSESRRENSGNLLIMVSKPEVVVRSMGLTFESSGLPKLLVRSFYPENVAAVATVRPISFGVAMVLISPFTDGKLDGAESYVRFRSLAFMRRETLL
jgi:hypothetical protein